MFHFLIILIFILIFIFLLIFILIICILILIFILIYIHINVHYLLNLYIYIYMHNVPKPNCGISHGRIFPDILICRSLLRSQCPESFQLHRPFGGMQLAHTHTHPHTHTHTLDKNWSIIGSVGNWIPCMQNQTSPIDTKESSSKQSSEFPRWKCER